MNHSTFDGIHIVNHYVGDDGSYQSSDEDGVKDTQQRSGGRITLHPDLGDTESEEEVEDDEALRLSVPQSGSHKSTTVWPAPAEEEEEPFPAGISEETSGSGILNYRKEMRHHFISWSTPMD